MAAPIAGVAIRVIVLRYGVAVARVVGRHIAKRALVREVRRKPKPPGSTTESRGGQHTASSRMARTKARKSMRGPSAQKRESRSYFRRDEERYRGRRTRTRLSS